MIQKLYIFAMYTSETSMSGSVFILCKGSCSLLYFYNRSSSRYRRRVDRNRGTEIPLGGGGEKWTDKVIAIMYSSIGVNRLDGEIERKCRENKLIGTGLYHMKGMEGLKSQMLLWLVT